MASLAEKINLTEQAHLKRFSVTGHQDGGVSARKEKPSRCPSVKTKSFFQHQAEVYSAQIVTQKFEAEIDALLDAESPCRKKLHMICPSCKRFFSGKTEEEMIEHEEDCDGHEHVTTTRWIIKDSTNATQKYLDKREEMQAISYYKSTLNEIEEEEGALINHNWHLVKTKGSKSNTLVSRLKRKNEEGEKKGSPVRHNLF